MWVTGRPTGQERRRHTRTAGWYKWGWVRGCQDGVSNKPQAWACTNNRFPKSSLDCVNGRELSAGWRLDVIIWHEERSDRRILMSCHLMLVHGQFFFGIIFSLIFLNDEIVGLEVLTVGMKASFFFWWMCCVNKKKCKHVKSYQFIRMIKLAMDYVSEKGFKHTGLVFLYGFHPCKDHYIGLSLSLSLFLPPVPSQAQ